MSSYGCLSTTSKLALSIPVAECTKQVFDSGTRIIVGLESAILGGPCLVDIDAMEARTSVATDLTTRCGNFRDRLRQRDGSCGEPIGKYQTSHLIPHSKGDGYIANLLGSRAGVPPRNGLLLCVGLHISILCESAFLKTPNFALTVELLAANERFMRRSHTIVSPNPISSMKLHWVALWFSALGNPRSSWTTCESRRAGGLAHNDTAEGSTTTRLVPHRYNLGSIRNASHSTSQPKESHIGEVMDVVMALDVLCKQGEDQRCRFNSR
ncbi:hypothetical protein BS47DRAFT_1400060 [Hydnum rufescens UP504]|uniref:Uncharacterized protein n=1 Tax=Hydnum rufescens UP504 TaxID=1448309 RepID=A0A9P6AH85_9AGAM|nr:hypothetical protein BS47DRAFT_1400060 [Hydnum rufescens UP504]